MYKMNLKIFPVLWCLLLGSSFTLYGQAFLVKDINPGDSDGLGLSNAPVFKGDAALYFPGWDQASTFNMNALWTTDGTSNGTRYLGNQYYEGQFDDLKFLGKLNEWIFFSFDSRVWRVNQQTDQVSELLADSNWTYSDVQPAGRVTATYKDRFYLKVSEATHGEELWVSDGTPEGTGLFKDLYTGYLPSRVNNFTVFQDLLYFTADDTTSMGLWRTDGTPEGTELVKRTSIFVSATILPPLDSLLLFASETAPFLNIGNELWRSDGTEAGTFVLKDIRPGSQSSDIGESFRMGDKVYFFANDGTNGRELWMTDGTEAGTQLLKDIYPGSSGSAYATFMGMVNGKALFTANDGVHSSGFLYEMWVTDGTPEGTQLLKDITPGAESEVRGNAKDFATFQKFAFFTSGSVPATNRELWITDGTEAGTQLFLELYPGNTGSNPGDFQIMDNKLFFAATTPQYGRELWSYDLSTLSSHEYHALTGISLFPTLSADGTVNLATESPDWSLVDISVMDRSGRTVFSQTDQTLPTTFSFNQLTPGMYFMQLVDRKNRRFTVKTFSVLRP